MTVDTNRVGNTLEIALHGRLDTITSPELEATIREKLEDADELAFDFADLEYISSAGLRVLLGAHKTMSARGGMKIMNVNEMVNEVFEITGFADILTIEK